MLLVVDNSMGHTENNTADLNRFLAHVPHVRVTSLADLGKISDTPTGIILTGSPLMVTATDIARHTDQFILNLLVLRTYPQVPTLAICFGAQLVNQLYGGRLQRLRTPFCADARLHHSNQPARFCLSYVIAEPPPAHLFMVTDTATIRGRRVPCLLQHRTKPLTACLFHPESHSATHYILNDFLNIKAPST
jgi:anthranilate/para-aminobenzoate synthase component II